MPNMFGGDQNHPAYDPRVKLNPKTELLVGDVLYTLKNGKITEEHVNGSSGVYTLAQAPKPVQEHFAKHAKKKG